MTRVLITGAGGFLGRRLAAAIAAGAPIAGPDGRTGPASRLELVDLKAPEAPAGAVMPVTCLAADLADPAGAAALGARGAEVIFHLAASLTLDAERAPDAAWAVNVEALRRMAEAAEGRPRLIFTSSIAVFGGSLPAETGDDLRPLPATGYGTHKAIAELMLADLSRRGRIDGRSLRLPIVVTRPGAPTPAVSDRIAALIREPLAGRDAVSPLPPETPVPLASAGAVVAGLLRLQAVAEVDLPPGRVLNLPAFTTTIGALADRVRAAGARGRVSFAPEPDLVRIVGSWPQRFVSGRAGPLGIRADAGLDAIIADHLAHDGGKV
ncbi:NAD-dependent epimerase/dehydratase family protein [Tistrella mobilis]|uniref:NAD-dependent epimerase/dehydratase family protein n=1 Tax=Tistrella mobilis TaxID=171437 RepID=UPI0031F5F169